MVLREALLDEMPPQVLDLLRDVGALVVEDQGDDVVRGMVLVGHESTRLVYEHAEFGHQSPKMKMARKTSPPLGGPGPFRQLIYSRFLETCLRVRRYVFNVSTFRI